MRERKYQAWDEVHKRFYNTGFTLTPDGRVAATYGLYPSGKLIVREYTGLKDKNDVEIYEGDILQNSNHKDMLCVVEWRSMVDYNNWFPKDRFEVTGNIYENPESVPGDTK